VPDEPLDLPPQAEVTVWIESKTEEAEIAEETRTYYQSLSEEEKAEDSEWGKGVANRLPNAWE
jgi:hypothetical protein